jgi:hypothetical protein
VIDQPLVAEKKSFPPRLLVILLLTMLAVGATCFYIILRSMWEHVAVGDPRKVLAQDIADSVRRQVEHRFQRRFGVE